MDLFYSSLSALREVLSTREARGRDVHATGENVGIGDISASLTLQSLTWH